MNFVLSYKRYNCIRWVIWLIYFFYSLVGFVFIQKPEVLFGIILAGILIRLSIIDILNNWYKSGFPRLLDWFRLGTFLTLILNFLNLIYFFDNEGYILVNDIKLVSTGNAVKVLFAILIGLIALKIGESFFKYSKENQRVYSDFSIKRIFYFYFLALVVGTGQLYLMINGFIGYGSDVNYNLSTFSFLFNIISITSPFLLVMFSICKFFGYNKSRFFTIYFYIFFILQFVFGFLSGMKENIIVTLLLVIVPYIISGKRITRLSVIITLFTVIIIYPVINNYRDVLNNTDIDKRQALNLAFISTFSNDARTILFTGGESYSSRFSLFPMAMYSVEIEESWKEYKNLDRYLLMPIAWVVPRVLLPGKPVSDTGTKLYETITGGINNSVTPSTFGWAYLEGGYIPVFISFLIFGFVVSGIEKKLGFHSFFGIAIYTILLTSLIKTEADIYFRLTGMMQTILISYILYKFFIKENYYKDYNFLSN